MPDWLTILLGVAFSWLLLVLAADSLLRLVYITASWTAPPTADLQEHAAHANLGVIVPARNEAAIIGNTLDQLLRYLQPTQLFVIADNCIDDTATIAADSGVQVWQRHQPDQPGKGAALTWFLQEAEPALDGFAYLLVLDADSVIEPVFFAALQSALDEGISAGQCFARSPRAASPVALLADFSEFLSHRVDDMARQRLGWAVPLRGRGMVFEHRVLRSLVGGLRTRVEDVELSLLLAAENIHIHFLAEAVLTDAKPPQVAAASRQRARWLQGQRQVWQVHCGLILRLLLRGRLEYLSLVFATLVKPKTVLLLLKAIWLVVAATVPGHPALRWGLGVAAGLALLVDLAYYLLGLRLVENPWRYALALAGAPLYLLMWIGSLFLSWLSRSPWLRSTPH